MHKVPRGGLPGKADEEQISEQGKESCLATQPEWSSYRDSKCQSAKWKNTEIRKSCDFRAVAKNLSLLQEIGRLEGFEQGVVSSGPSAAVGRQKQKQAE